MSYPSDRNRNRLPLGSSISAIGLFALLVASCQRTTDVVEPSPDDPFAHYAHFRLQDRASLPDSIWYHSQQDSGTTPLSFDTSKETIQVSLFPILHALGRDSLQVQTWRLGVRTGTCSLKEVTYGELSASRVIRTGPDSLAGRLLGLYDSLRVAHAASSSRDTSSMAQREIFRQTIAELVLQGHPATTTFRKFPPVGLDTADITRRTLALVLKSNLSLGQIVKQWTLGMDYQTARAALTSQGLDSLPLNPFRIAQPLRLDTLRLEEPAVGLFGKISARLGIQSLSFSVTNDSGNRTDRFLLADAPSATNQSSLDLAGHPTFAPRANTALGRYTLRLVATDSLGNKAEIATSFWVKGALDHAGPIMDEISPASTLMRPFADSFLVVRVKATDPSGVRSVKVGSIDADRGTDRVWSARIVVPISASSQKVDIVATDSAGNDRTSQILIRRDTPPVPTVPRLHLVKPANKSLVPFDSVSVVVSWSAATDFGKIESVLIGEIAAKNTHDSTWELRVDLPPNGKLADIGVRAQSSVGLISNNFVSIGRKADSAGPIIRWISPAQGHRVGYDVTTLEVTATASDLSGIDSVRIEGKVPDTTKGNWRSTVSLAGPGEISRIHVMAWDHAGNKSDSVLLVSRDPIPKHLGPSYRWINPPEKSGTVVPFDSTGIWIRTVLTDISGIDAASVNIDGVLATRIDDSTWARRVDLAPTGVEAPVTLEAKNSRGIPISDFVRITRLRDSIHPTCGRLANPVGSVVPFDTTSVEIGWTASDNDRIAKAWIQNGQVGASAKGYMSRVPLVVGTQWVAFRAEDPAGNQVLDSILLERRPDTIAPKIQRRAGTQNTIVTFDTTSIEVGWTASDNDRITDGWIQGLTATPSASGFIARVPLTVGTQWVRFRTQDATGNFTTDSVQVQRWTDTTSPRAQALATNRARVVPYDTSSVLAGWTATDNDRIDKVWIHDVLVSATSEGYVRSVPLAQGVQWIRFKAQDPMGNSVQDSFRMERLPMDTAAPVVISDTNSQLRGGSFLVTLSTTTSGARIHYTLDGSEPTETSPEYGVDPRSIHDGDRSLWIDTTVTVKARAFATNRTPGRILTQRYQLALPVAVSGGLGHSLFLLTDGSLWGAGNNARNAFKAGDQGLYLEPVKIADSVVQMSAGRDFSVWVKQDGSLWGIGANDSGSLGDGSNTDRSSPILIRKDVARAQAFNWRHILVLAKDGGLWVSGTNLFGQLGTGRIGFEPSLVQIASEVTQFGGGDAHTYFLKKDGTFWVSGAPWSGRLGFLEEEMVLIPTRSLDNVAWIPERTGNTTFVRKLDGSLVGFGANDWAAMGTGDTQSIVLPRRLVEIERLGAIKNITGHFHTIILTESGEAWGVGYNASQQASSSSLNPVLSPDLVLSGVQDVFSGAHHSFAITQSGCLFGWGNNAAGQLGNGKQSEKTGVTRVRF